MPSNPPGRQRDRAFVRPLLVLAGLLAGIACAEAAGILLDIAPLSAHLRPTAQQGLPCVRPDADSGYAFVPSRCGANSLGFIDREPAPTRAAGEVRIVALGDSVTHQKYYTDFLEAILSSRLGVPVDVWNTGAPGLSTPEEVGLLRSRGTELDPDVVLLQFSPNDFSNTPVFFEYQGQVWLGENSGGEFAGVSRPLYRYSSLYRTWVHARVAWRGGGGGGPLGRVDAVRSALADLYHLTEARGVPALVVRFPHLHPPSELPPELATVSARMTTLARDAGLAVIDLSREFERVGWDAVRLGRTDEAWGRLDRILADEWDEAALRGCFAAHAPTHFGVGRSAHIADDTIHPNFYGHMVAAVAIADALTARRAKYFPGGRDR
ncbi:GDSL-type esterase/lipase family protein [Myxococcota bacterium]|nr:GDSL-type esterase/lipase family protein [Myxococcota bacterium]